jgi:hypothetical protein
MKSGDGKIEIALKLGSLVNGNADDSHSGVLGRRREPPITPAKAKEAIDLLEEGAVIIGFCGASKPGEKYVITIQLEGKQPYKVETDIPLCTMGRRDRKERLMAVLLTYM